MFIEALRKKRQERLLSYLSTDERKSFHDVCMQYFEGSFFSIIFTETYIRTITEDLFILEGDGLVDRKTEKILQQEDYKNNFPFSGVKVVTRITHINSSYLKIKKPA